MSRAERLIQQLYEDPGLRDELTDDEAAPLLKWAEGEAVRLDAEKADDADFEAVSGALSRLVEQINRYVVRRDALPPAEAQAAVEKISALASEIGRTMQPVAMASALAAAPDPKTSIEALTAMISADSAPDAADDAPRGGLQGALGRRPTQRADAPPDTHDAPDKLPPPAFKLPADSQE